jgi:putative transposase
MNNLNPERKVTRLSDFDYGQTAAYFVTICTQEGRMLFGEVVVDEVRLSLLGQLVHQAWLAIPQHYSMVTVDEYVVMPNHLHGILFLLRENTTDMASHVPTRRFGALRAATLSSIVGNFKSGVSREAHRLGLNGPIWQSRFYEDVIREDEDLCQVRRYIQENPLKWALDKENPKNL